MAIRYDPILVSGIAREIRSRWIGRRVAGLRLDRETREAWVLLSEGPDAASTIGFLLHPSLGFILGGAAPSPGDERAVRRIEFRRLFLSAVWAPEDERLLVLEFAGDARRGDTGRQPVHRLFIELQTNQWNAVLARGVDDHVEAVLWSRAAGSRSLRPGVSYERPEGARAWAAEVPGESEWIRFLEPIPPEERRETLLRSVAWTSSLNVNWILGDATAEDAAHDELALAFARYSRIRTAADEAWLLSRRTVTQPYPVALGVDARRVDSLLEGMREAAEESSVWRGPEAPGTGPAAVVGTTLESDRLRDALRNRIRRLEKRRAALKRQLEGESADHLRDLGNLLLTRQDEAPKGTETVNLTGFDGTAMDVHLDPRLDAVQNAERMFDLARRRERAANEIPGRVRRTEQRIARLAAALETARTSEPSEELWDLAGGKPEGRRVGGGKRPPVEDEPLPYRRYRSSGGFEIRVGRSAKANDSLTFRHSAPEDIWLHARQAAGAHVILRWERRDQNPPLPDLTEAAVLAALRSEARHSGVVAVDWTRRKHVRKPRKAAPGIVVPERVSTLFVEPDPAVEAKLTPDD